MNWLTAVVVIVVILSVINYAGLTIYYHRWAEGTSARSGITRAYLPGMNLIGVVFIWNLTRLLQTGGLKNSFTGLAFISYFGLLFRQTRMRIIAASLTAAWMFIREKRYGLVLIASGVILTLSSAVAIITQKNLFIETFTTSFENYSKNEGTWSERSKTIEMALRTFREHPVVGSGALVIRQTGPVDITQTRRIMEDAYQGDLGYVHWLKNFGLIGALWMAIFIIVVFVRNRSMARRANGNFIDRFVEYQFLHMLFSNITIDYFTRFDGIIVMSLVLAMASRPLQHHIDDTSLVHEKVPSMKRIEDSE